MGDELDRVRNDLEQSDDENTTLRWSVLITCALATCGICATAAVSIWAWKRRKSINVKCFSDIVVGQPIEDGEKWNNKCKKTIVERHRCNGKRSPTPNSPSSFLECGCMVL